MSSFSESTPSRRFSSCSPCRGGSRPRSSYRCSPQHSPSFSSRSSRGRRHACFAGTIDLWPVHAGPADRPYRWVRVAGAGVVALLAAWTVFFSQLSGNLFAYSPALDPWIALLKGATLIVCVGGTVVALWDLLRAVARRKLAVASREPPARARVRHGAVARRRPEARGPRNGLLRRAVPRLGIQQALDRVLDALVVAGLRLGVDALAEGAAGLGA